MGKIFYQLFLFFYPLGIKIAFNWNKKARQWIEGRKQFPSFDSTQKTIWMHCASLGEFEQGRPLLEAVRIQYPQHKIVLSFFSPSGFEIRKNYPGADYIFYLPMDAEKNASKLIDAINPGLVLWVKYEFWYYYLTELKKRNIPVLMVSGIFRKNQPFFKWYGKIWIEMLQSFSHFFVQNTESATLLSTVGIKKNISISGDTRFDRVIEIAKHFKPIPIIEKFCGNSKVIVAGSTWDDDEAELVHYVKNNPAIKFIIAPHEIDEFNLYDVKETFTGAVFFSKILENEALINDCHVLIIDNIGMLSKLYQYAHITYIGGGFAEDGIHNILEAAVFGKPIIFGPEYEKFAEAVELVEIGAAISIGSALELEKVMNELWNNEKLLEEKGALAKKYVYSKQGATKNIMAFIQENRFLIN